MRLHFEPSEEYKLMMDKMIDNHNTGKTKYMTETEFRKAINFYQENKEQNEKIIKLYEARLQDKERLIVQL